MSAVERRTLPLYEAGSVDVPFVIAAMDERLGRDTHWEDHAHPTHELIWNEQGPSTVTVGPRTWTITRSVGLWMPAGVVHSAIAPAGTWYRAAQFGTHAVPAVADVPTAIEITPILRLLLQRLEDESLASESRALTEAMVVDVLVPAKHELVLVLPRADLLQPIVAATVKDPGDPRTLGQWARALGVSPRTISRAFEAETGLGFSRWVLSLRAHRAARLMAEGLPIELVADLTGYHSASAFTAAFKRTTGMTPGSFRSGERWHPVSESSDNAAETLDCALAGA